MHAIYAYIDPPNHPNVCIHGIHGVSGMTLPQHPGDVHHTESLNPWFLVVFGVDIPARLSSAPTIERSMMVTTRGPVPKKVTLTD